MNDEVRKQILQRLKDDFRHYAGKCLMIRTKEGSVEPFKLNRAQQHIHDKIEHQKLVTGKVRALVLKGRQQGCSTYVEGRFYWLCTHRFGVRAFILAHEEDATKNLFEMAKRYHEHCPAVIKVSTDASNAKELVFGKLDSGYRLGTAGNKSVGRSSTIQYLHGSEVAYWQNAADHAKGVLQAVPSGSGTEVILESTANGVGNYFHEQWQMAEAGLSDFIAIFVPWFWQEEYTREVPLDFVPDSEEQELIELYGLTEEQLCWRRYKIQELSVNGIDGSKAFCAEYPNTSTESFVTTGEDSYIAPDIAMRARRGSAEPYGPLLVGVDPARFGNDRTSIIRRRGRVAYSLQSYIKKDVMEVAGLVYKIIQDERPHKVFIDVGGLGAGVYDRLKELIDNNLIVAVNSSNTPLDADKYQNKRAEMWGTMREWLCDHPVKIPDVDDLQSDLCNIKYTWDSKTRLLMESKEKMKKRGIRSPDGADSLALTFALPEVTLQKATNNTYDKIAQSFGQHSNHMDRIKKAAHGNR